MVDWTPSGAVFGQMKSADALAEKAWPFLPRRGIFISADGFLDRPRHNKKSAVRRHKTKISGFKSNI